MSNSVMKGKLGELTDGRVISTVDVTPTWSGTVLALILMIENGTPTSKAYAKGELIRMARILDSKLGNL